MPQAEDPAVPVTLVAPPPAVESVPRRQTEAEEQSGREQLPIATPEPQESPPPAPWTHIAPAQESAPVPPPPVDPGSRMIEARSFYAATVLARPENRSARDALKTLSAEARDEQICDTEAMEQISRAKANLRPDRLIAYALENTHVDGDRIEAAGAAFRSAHRWFRLSFDCTLDAKRNTVTAFRFSIGDPIPSSRWTDLQLER